MPWLQGASGPEAKVEPSAIHDRHQSFSEIVLSLESTWGIVFHERLMSIDRRLSC